MPSEPTTARVLAEKALEMPCGQTCVDWAVARLLAGDESEALATLASLSPPHHHFEVAALRDRALLDLRISALDPHEAVRAYAAERYREALAHEAAFPEVLRELAGLYASHDADALLDAYLLHHAHDSLLHVDEQHYWDGATRATIQDVIRRHAEAFIAAHEEARLSREPDA